MSDNTPIFDRLALSLGYSRLVQRTGQDEKAFGYHASKLPPQGNLGPNKYLDGPFEIIQQESINTDAIEVPVIDGNEVLEVVQETYAKNVGQPIRVSEEELTDADLRREVWEALKVEAVRIAQDAVTPRPFAHEISKMAFKTHWDAVNGVLSAKLDPMTDDVMAQAEGFEELAKGHFEGYDKDLYEIVLSQTSEFDIDSNMIEVRAQLCPKPAQQKLTQEQIDQANEVLESVKPKKTFVWHDKGLEGAVAALAKAASSFQPQMYYGSKLKTQNPVTSHLSWEIHRNAGEGGRTNYGEELNSMLGTAGFGLPSKYRDIAEQTPARIEAFVYADGSAQIHVDGVMVDYLQRNQQPFDTPTVKPLRRGVGGQTQE